MSNCLMQFLMSVLSFVYLAIKVLKLFTTGMTSSWSYSNWGLGAYYLHCSFNWSSYSLVQRNSTFLFNVSKVRFTYSKFLFDEFSTEKILSLTLLTISVTLPEDILMVYSEAVILSFCSKSCYSILFISTWKCLSRSWCNFLSYSKSWIVTIKLSKFALVLTRASNATKSSLLV